MTPVDPLDGIPLAVFEARRASVLRALGRGVMVLPAAPLLHRSRDTEVAYRADSELFWTTGATEVGAVAVLVGGDEPRSLLFVRERDAEAELWSGPRLGPDGAAERLGMAETYPRSELDFRLPGLLRAGDRVHFRLGRDVSLDRAVVEALAETRARGARRGTGPRGVVDPGEILDELRLVKDAWEVERLRAAAALSVEAHRAGIAAIRPGAGEWEVQAAVDAALRRGSGSGPGYETIVGSGPNACVLHYVANRRVIGGDDAVLLDAGAEVALYQGDITRTYPAGGAFTHRQRALYDVVEAARAAAVAGVAPGTTVGDVHSTAVRTIVDGLLALGILAGRAEDLIEQEAYRPYFPHQTSHWLGLDVHDVGDYAKRGASRPLEPGMVLTVEPGIYVPPGQEGAAAPWAGIGVRIEDDVLVTDRGHENLTAALPTRAEDVEALAGELR
ncbi:MAG TPA: aminopeptidase P N-terminal domain-containing protein [Longimicrobiales bacterium]|nr:aminopeptidase P N-terminal domain-containing protein [Longimicrobiales bacterium]